MESSEPDPVANAPEDIVRHIKQCDGCMRFREDLEKIRTGLIIIKVPASGESLFPTTQSLCHTRIEEMASTRSRVTGRSDSSSLPKVVWAIIAALIGLTLYISLTVLKDLQPDQAFTFQERIVLTIIIQNVAMLIFAPLLMRKHRHRWGSGNLQFI
jgi:hypothetical protein